LPTNPFLWALFWDPEVVFIKPSVFNVGRWTDIVCAKRGPRPLKPATASTRRALGLKAGYREWLDDPYGPDWGWSRLSPLELELVEVTWSPRDSDEIRYAAVRRLSRSKAGGLVCYDLSQMDSLPWWLRIQLQHARGGSRINSNPGLVERTGRRKMPRFSLTLTQSPPEMEMFDGPTESSSDPEE
jgi:hypothetical protein